VPPNQNQPAYIRLINRAGRVLERAGLSVPTLDAKRLIHRAQWRTGLRDFGDNGYLEGLERLTDELHTHANLSLVGKLAAYFNLTENLCARMNLVEYRRQHPEILTETINRPLFILGLPRTGTTILFELIAQDPAMRYPASWEVAKPVPPAMRGTYETDGRIRTVERFMGLAEQLSPGFRAIHTIGAQLPQECVYIFASQFVSEQFGYMFDIPQYRDWILDRDMTDAYRWHSQFLQHMQADYRGEHWVLKTPSHLAYLRYLLAQYPDANIVWTHRQPIDAIASLSSLATNLRGGFSDTVNPKAVAAHEMQHFAKQLNMGMQQRRQLDRGQFLDISFASICDDPINSVRGIYHYFDIPLSGEAESRMRDYLVKRPRDLHGKHDYCADQFALTRARESDLFRDYLDRFAPLLA
jgi:hypothetical protein